VSAGWRYELSPRAMRDIERLSDAVQRRIYAGLDRLAADSRTCDVVKLQGEEGWYRLRVGDWRILFTRDDDARVYTVAKIADRKDVYR
jgi:mRNA interferase RelE/StbE